VGVPLPWERLLWTRRRRPWVRYALTDFRLVVVRGRQVEEMALQDLGDIQRTRSKIDRLLGTSTLAVHSRKAAAAPLVLPHLREGPQLAALLELLAGQPQAQLDERAVRAALAWKPREARRGAPEALVGVAAVVVAMSAVAIGLHGNTPAVVYPAGDAIYPGGLKRDRQAILEFMESAVMPWARETLGPITGGPDRVTCETCHGRDAEARGWGMPAVAALPEPHVRGFGLEVYSAAADAQMRNAIYGYLAEADNQTKAAYMREVVVPGMARLLGRPAYDFTRSYDYNRQRFAFGCYHCHNVREGM
jgi:hypothetical protein